MKKLRANIIFAVLLFCIFPLKANAYGDKFAYDIGGYQELQSHYEIQNQYVSDGYFYIEGFYYVYALQNYTQIGVTHNYQLVVGDKTYDNIGGYYVDLTELERVSSRSWATNSESAVTYPNLNKNYRYRDIGFRFAIPLSDLSGFKGASYTYQMQIRILAMNTAFGRGVQIDFTQNVFATKAYPNLSYGGYQFCFDTSLNTNMAQIFADVGMIRTSPYGSNVSFCGSSLYWLEGEWFTNLTDANTYTTNGSDSVTWYGLRYGYEFYDGQRFRACFNPSGNIGFIPSIWLGPVAGNVYKITVVNTPPTINASSRSINESNSINLMDSVSATDDQDGTITDKIQLVNTSGLNTSRAKAGSYIISYSVTDHNGLNTTKSVTVTVNNIAPTITASNKTFDYEEKLTKDMLLSNVSASDLYDGTLTSKVSIINYGGLKINSTANAIGDYNVTYSVTDSNGSTTTKTIVITIGFTNTTIDSDIYETSRYIAVDYIKGDLEKGIYVYDKNGNDITKYFEFSLENIHPYIWGTSSYYPYITGHSYSEKIYAKIKYRAKGLSTWNYYERLIYVYDWAAAMLKDKTYEYGTNITEDMIKVGNYKAQLAGVKYSDGTNSMPNTCPRFGIYTDQVSVTLANSGGLILNSSTNKVGKYLVTFQIMFPESVSLGKAFTKTVSMYVNIIPKNDKPTISASNKNYTEATYITDSMLLNGVSAYDNQEGVLTSRVLIADRGGIDSTKPAKAGSYSVTYRVTDSADATTLVTVTVTVTNVIPTITANYQSYKESTPLTYAMLLEGVTASDPYDGDISSRVTLYGIDDKLRSMMSKPKAGSYTVVYMVRDSNGAFAFKSIIVAINNIPPTIFASNKSFSKGTFVSDAMLLDGVTASDPYDGVISSKIIVTNRGGLAIASMKAETGTYSITYSVTDSNGVVASKTITVMIDAVVGVQRRLRYISKEYLYTLDMSSKWYTNSNLKNELEETLSKSGKDAESIQIWTFTSEQIKEIKEYEMSHAGENNNIWFETKYSGCRTR